MSALLKPCVICGELTDESKCLDHRPKREARVHTERTAARGYDWQWQKLSSRARALQPFCSDCLTTEDLTADHSTEAWLRKAEGKPIRLEDIDVVCRSCNGKRGKARPEDLGGEA